MALLKDLGRTNALREVTSDIRGIIAQKRAEGRQEQLDEQQAGREVIDIGFRQRAEDRAIEQHEANLGDRAVSSEINNMQLNQMRQEEERDNTWEPEDVMRAKLPGVTDSTWEKMLDMMGDKFTKVGDNYGAIVRDQRNTMTSIIGSVEAQAILNMETIKDFTGQKKLVIEALQNPKLKPEQREQLEQNLSGINQGLIASSNGQRELDAILAEEKVSPISTVDKKRTNVIKKRIFDLEKAKFAAKNKGKSDPLMTMWAAERGLNLPDPSEPKGLQEYLELIDTQLLELNNEIGGQQATQIGEQTEQELIPVTEEIAQQYFDDANGDVNLAEENLVRDGYDIR